jgi:hypothetical protein
MGSRDNARDGEHRQLAIDPQVKAPGRRPEALLFLKRPEAAAPYTRQPREHTHTAHLTSLGGPEGPRDVFAYDSAGADTPPAPRLPHGVRRGNAVVPPRPRDRLRRTLLGWRRGLALRAVRGPLSVPT